MRRGSSSLTRFIWVSSVLLLPTAAGAQMSPDSAKSFLADMDRAMGWMDADMMVKPAGDVDHEFVAMMVPHHQGAIDMAVAELRYGRDQQLKRIAQEIIVDQQQEIAAMRFALRQPLPPPAAAPTTFGAAADHAGIHTEPEH